MRSDEDDDQKFDDDNKTMQQNKYYNSITKQKFDDNMNSQTENIGNRKKSHILLQIYREYLQNNISSEYVG